MRTRFNILAHLEHGNFGVETFRLNFPDVPVATDFSMWNAEQFKGKADVVYGNPPCAAFSPVGRSMKRGSQNWRTDERMEFSRQMNTLMQAVEPTIWVHESVPEILTRGWDYSMEVARQAVDLGYSVTFFRHDAKLFGMPMQRRRIFTIAHKVELEFHDPPCIRNDAGMVLDGADLDKPHGKYFPLAEDRLSYVRMIREGRARDMVDAFNQLHPGQERGRPRIFETIVQPDIPCGSISGQGAFLVHPWDDRYLSPYEVAEMAGYPPTYRWSDLEWAEAWADKQANPRGSWSGAGINASDHWFAW
jgi:site-specific DNA-cytosine methylase